MTQKHVQTGENFSVSEYRRLFEDAHFGVIILSEELRFEKISHAFTDCLGYTIEDLEQYSLTDIMHPSSVQTMQNVLSAVRRCKGNNNHVELRYIKKNGDVLWGDTHFSAICGIDGEIQCIQAIIENVTDRKSVEAELKEKNIRILEKEQVIRKLNDEFIFIAAHELKSPVTAINWAIDLLGEVDMKKANVATKIQLPLSMIQESIKRLNDLVTELLEVSRIAHGSFKVVREAVEISPIIKSAVKEVSALAKNNDIQIKVIPIEKDVPLVFGDEQRMREVLVNLLNNAIKYNKKGGSVIIDIAVTNECVLISVIDSGIGIEKGDLDKLFRRFSRLETTETHDVEGTGLGLFIAKQLAERMDGNIWVTSEGRGKGSTFTFAIPIVKKMKK